MNIKATTSKEPDLNAVSLSSSSVPSLSPELKDLYNSLDGVQKSLFMRVFRFVWGVLFGRKQLFKQHVLLYWGLELVRSRSSLSPSDLSILSYLYQVTNKGANIVSSETFYKGLLFTGVDLAQRKYRLVSLKKRGYITRHTFNSDLPYLRSSRSNHKLFIKMTLKGVQCIERIEKDLNNLLLNTCLNDLTGQTTKKPG